MNDYSSRPEFQAMLHQANSSELRKKMIAGFSKDPSNLLGLFKNATTQDNQWHLNDSKSFGKLFKNIKKLDSAGAFDKNQIQDIIQITSRIYSSHTDPALKSASVDFLATHLDKENVYSHLEYAKKMNAPEFIQKCLEFIENEEGVKITANDSSLSIEISNPKVSFGELSTKITTLSKIYDSKIAITLRPVAPVDPSILQGFLEKHGKSVASLHLLVMRTIDDDFCSKYIKSCPNLHQLFISSNKITTKGLEGLSNLTTLTTLYFHECERLTALPPLPATLTALGLSWCERLTVLPPLPVNLTMINLFNCVSLTALPPLPATLTTLDFSWCQRLTVLPPLPANLTMLNLSVCTSLTELPPLPANLTTLNLSACASLTELPPLPANLTTLNVSGCRSLTEKTKLMTLSSLLDANLDLGFKYYQSFDIDGDAFCKLLAEKLSGKSIMPGQDYLLVLVEALEKKLSDPATPPSTLNVLGQYIYDNDERLQLHEEHPLMQDAQGIIALNSVEGEKNAYNLFKNLKELVQKPSDFKTPAIEIEGVRVAINRKQLEALSQRSKLRREDLPKNATREAFDQLANALKDKIENKEGAAKALADLGTDAETVMFPIFSDPSQRLARYLDLSGENVSDTEAKWRAVLSNIFGKETGERQGFFTEQEEVFILTMMGIQECPGGKDMGIALSYEQLDRQYRYKITISKPVSSEDSMMIRAKEEAFAFLKDFKGTPKEFHAFLNSGTRVPAYIYEMLLENKSNYEWDEVDDAPRLHDDTLSYLISEEGALNLLRMKNVEAVSPLIAETIQKVMAAQFTGTNALMGELTGLDENDIEQGAHQAIYLKNLIGHLVGVSTGPVFDRYSMAINDSLLEKDRDEVLRILFQHITPEGFVHATIKAVNESPAHIELVKSFLGDKEEFWNHDEMQGLSRKGAVALLQELHYLV